MKSEQSVGHEISFSPTHYSSPLEITLAIDLDRLVPDRRVTYEQWSHLQSVEAARLIPDEFTGRDGKMESIGIPTARAGLIACASVSGSADYNKRLKALDRKILAIETESGGLFAIAQRDGIAALTIRGISDYAGFGADKNKFEEQTQNKARTVAASNAASFLILQLQNPGVSDFISRRRGISKTTLNAPKSSIDKLRELLLSQGEYINARLKELAPSFALQDRGYKIPVPRIRISSQKTGSVSPDPEHALELREALKRSHALIVQIPPEFPDRSLAWIIGRDLMTGRLADKQLLPTVIVRHLSGKNSLF